MLLGFSDCVACFSCGLLLSQWLVTDNAFEEHYVYAIKECEYLKKYYKPSDRVKK